MAIARLGTPITGGSASNSGSFVANAPAAITDGSLWAIFISHAASSGTTPRTLTFSAGGANAWAELGGPATTAYKTTIIWKRWQTGDPTSVTVTFSGNAVYSYISACYTGQLASGSPWGTPTNRANATSTTNTVGPMTTVDAGSWSLIVGSVNSASATWTALPGGGFSEWAQIAGGKRIDLLDLSTPTPGTIVSPAGTPLTYTVSATNQSNIITVELRPAVTPVTFTKSGGAVSIASAGGADASVIAKSSGAVSIARPGAVGSGTVVSAKAITQERLSLGPLGVPLTQTGHSIRLKAQVVNPAHSVYPVVELWEGAVKRSGPLNGSTLTGTLTWYTINIPDVDAASITDYSNLEIRIGGTAPTGHAAQIRISQLELNIPQAVPAQVYGGSSGGRSVASVGGAKTVRVAKSSGATSPKLAGATRIAQVVKSAGGNAVAAPGATRAVAIAKSSGGISPKVGGATTVVAAPKAAGAVSVAKTGATVSRAIAKSSGAVSVASTGGARVFTALKSAGGRAVFSGGETQAKAYAKSSGGQTAASSGAAKGYLIGKSSGAFTAGKPGQTRTAQISKSSGALALAVSGGAKSIGYPRSSGAASGALAGQTRLWQTIKTGGAFSTASGGASRGSVPSKAAGALAVGKPGQTRLVVIAKSSGAASIASTGATAARAVAITKSSGAFAAGKPGATQTYAISRPSGALTAGKPGYLPSARLVARSSGGQSTARGGITNAHATGARAVSFTGATRLVKILKSSGAASQALAGTARGQAKSGGALAGAVGGAVRAQIVSKASGAVSTARAGAGRLTIASKGIGASSLARTGGSQAVKRVYSVSSGALTSLTGGAQRGIAITRSAGSTSVLSTGAQAIGLRARLGGISKATGGATVYVLYPQEILPGAPHQVLSAVIPMATLTSANGVNSEPALTSVSLHKPTLTGVK